MLMFSVALFSCSDSDSNNDVADEAVVNMLPATQPVVLNSEQRGLVANCNAFSYRLYQSIGQQGAGSNVFSPASVTFLLSMLSNGAQGGTEQEIMRLWNIDAKDREDMTELCSKLMEELPQTDPSVTLQLANISVANNTELSEAYRSLLRDEYSAEAVTLDFTQPSATQYVNDWCSEHTDGMIPEIVDRLDASLKFVMMNAVFFKATWAKKFDPKDTRKGTFTTIGGSPAEVPFMHQKIAALYSENDTYSTVTLPYGSGDRWCMTILLPNEGSTVADVVSMLDHQPWQQSDSRAHEIEVSLPRFKTCSEFVLNDALSELGCRAMFTPGEADFSLMTSADDLFVSLLKQKAAIEVTEDGTQASAVTVTEMNSYADFKLPQAKFYADHSFVYLIHETSSGLVLFMGTYDGD